MLNVKLLNNSGIGVHHMWDHYFADNNAFERNLTRLEPTLRKLARNHYCRLVESVRSCRLPYQCQWRFSLLYDVLGESGLVQLNGQDYS